MPYAPLPKNVGLVRNKGGASRQESSIVRLGLLTASVQYRGDGLLAEFCLRAKLRLDPLDLAVSS